MNIHTKDPRIDDYIASLPSWQQAICKRVRALIHLAEPDICETIKRTTLPYFTLDGNVCALLASKDHVSVFIYDPIAPDPKHIINQGHGNLTARSIRIDIEEKLPEKAFMQLIKAIVASNRAGGWRKLQKSHTPDR